MVDCWSLDNRRTYIVVLFGCSNLELHLSYFWVFACLVGSKVLLWFLTFFWEHSQYKGGEGRGGGYIVMRLSYEWYQLWLKVFGSNESIASHKPCLQYVWSWKLFSRVDSYASPKLIECCECAKGKTYAKLIPLRIEIQIVYWPFRSFDMWVDARLIAN